ncbi:Mss4-like protein [Desarmillaria tabescens]|uniref:Mss4-like protein n=1 Tax=Armillaria tabescens TaxID=1929756 RepID=A0AA39NIQ3_ARMTA|nr:Mss4-like protein [Desarmillaria tabescens]KAK0466345.1 Mss4-like protein [Desarmillaria tabescens]
MGEDIETSGGCYCGQLRYTVRGLPLLSAFCHCTLCQRFNSAVFIHTIHFSSAAFSWTRFEEDKVHIYEVADKPWKRRHRCANCGCTVASFNTKKDEWSVWGAQLDRDDAGKRKNWELLKPTAHIFYETRMVDIADDLGKWDGYEGLSNRLPM